MPPQSPEDLTAALPSTAREIEEFVDAAGWDQPTQVFALVPTRRLLAAEPGLADQLDPDAALTPIAQEALPAEDLAEALSRIEWPEQVCGCALVQEIVVLPPEAEAELPGDAAAARQAAAAHPQRREARLVAAVLRDGGETCVMRLRASVDGDGTGGEVIQDPSLAPNLLTALHATFAE
ncbi:PPA1309 family protein [Saccharopolyspora sp. 5N708]|uniref:PPA1309 family protein n=1 Tax=Saccharopolyspora sp. 5N708 TaxID=3457424 RepID=UPI003FD33EA5